ncbi:MAG: hypothetical protein L6Q57_06670 [Alphaproteobacteria bacterium]|nr:hypothetical protein [Alphaproteobacteria bacterium]
MRLILVLFALVLYALPCYAEEKNAPVLSDEEVKKSIESAQDKTHTLIEKIIDGKSEENKKHFFMAYTVFNLLETVKMVKGDVNNAILSCADKNPAMKDRLQTRYKTWKAATDKPMKEAQANLDNMLVAQDYAKQEDIKTVFKTLNETREITKSQMVKEPVTTPEACEFLYQKMDETQENLVTLINSTLVSVPQAYNDTPSEEEQGEDQTNAQDDKAE